MSKYTSDARQRRSKRYLALHAQLAAEVAAKSKPRTLAHRSAKQVAHFAKSELFRLYADNI